MAIEKNTMTDWLVLCRYRASWNLEIRWGTAKPNNHILKQSSADIPTQLDVEVESVTSIGWSTGRVSGGFRQPRRLLGGTWGMNHGCRLPMIFHLAVESSFRILPLKSIRKDLMTTWYSAIIGGTLLHIATSLRWLSSFGREKSEYKREYDVSYWAIIFLTQGN